MQNSEIVQEQNVAPCLVKLDGMARSSLAHEIHCRLLLIRELRCIRTSRHKVRAQEYASHKSHLGLAFRTSDNGSVSHERFASLAIGMLVRSRGGAANTAPDVCLPVFLFPRKRIGQLTYDIGASGCQFVVHLPEASNQLQSSTFRNVLGKHSNDISAVNIAMKALKTSKSAVVANSTHIKENEN
jgi:hypothetical protein